VAQYLTVYGGPAFNQTTQTGFWSPTLHVSPGSTAGNGVAVGGATKYKGGQGLGTRAVRWDAGRGGAVELGNLGTSSYGVTRSEAYAVNPTGTAVGFAEKYIGGTSREYRAVRWDASGTVATELGTFGADLPGCAYAINAAGTAVGSAGGAVRWDAGGTAATELGNLGLPPFGETMANDINGAGITVGFSQKSVNGTTMGRAVLWDFDTIDAIDLNTLIDPAGGWTLVNARGITDTNWISGVGIFDPDGAGGMTPYGRAFLIQVPAAALPEPSVGCVMLIVAFSLVRRGRRFKSS
jgi:hypothetical protein